MKRGKCAKFANGAFPPAGPEKMRHTKHFLDGGRRERGLAQMMAERRDEAATGGTTDPRRGRYRKGAIEEPLLLALERVPGLATGDRELEARDGDQPVLEDGTNG